MSLLFSCQSLSKSYGGTKPLFKELEISIFSGDRIGLVGLNGCGKSTLLKILAGIEKPDSGILAPKKGLRVGYVPQSCEFPSLSPKKILMDALDSSLPEYEREYTAEIQLSRLGFTGSETDASLLSGGWKKRLHIGMQLITSPDILLLDEPTNHLDVEGIQWLEKFLKTQSITYLLISHDRYFLENVTTKIIEINTAYPTGFFVSEGSYETFLSRKELFLQGQLEQERSLASKARRETEWLRAGVKARTTKATSRVDAAEELLESYADIKARNLKKKTVIDFASTERKTAKLLVAKDLAKSLGGTSLFKELDLTLSPGTRIGLIGPNGSGKTTLLRMFAGEAMPDHGSITRADGVAIVYFDQHRAKIPLDISLRKALAPNGEFVTFRGAQIHVNGWCKRFLFSPESLELPVSSLSGGERARISIAHLMLQPADILLLDEPTNDLDIPTIEILEESLLEFPGAVVLITHDRYMLDRICTGVLPLGCNGKAELFPDFAQLQRTIHAKTKTSEQKKPKSSAPIRHKQTLSSEEKKELNSIQGKISKLEQEVRSLNALLEKKEIAENPSRLREVCEALGLVETQIEQLYLRWEHLESLDRK